MTPAVSSMLQVFALWLCLASLCCSSGQYSETYKATYRVDGEGPASLTYANPTGGTEQRQVTLPWTETFTARRGQFLYLSAQDRGGIGLVICSITVNGRVVKDATSKGEYTIATVSDTCCKE